MSVNNLLSTHAVKGTVGMVLACVIFLWPQFLSLLTAAAILGFSVRQFRESFRQLDEANARKRRDRDRQVIATVVNPASNGDRHLPVLLNVECSPRR